MAATVPKIQTPPVSHLSNVDRIKLVKDYHSPSASNRVRAVNALKTPNKHKRYSMFDVAHEQEEIVTEAEREAIHNLKPKTIQEIFEKTRIYVEVRSGDMDHTPGIQNVVSQLGATTCNTVGKTTTHVIFKDGLNSTYSKAKKMGIPIVSVLWIEACRKLLILADPSKYPISNIERYENPELYKRVRRPISKVLTPKLNLTQKSRFSLTPNVNKFTPMVKTEVKVEPKVIEVTPKFVPKPIEKPLEEEKSAKLPIKTETNLWSQALDNINRVSELSKDIKPQPDTALFSPEMEKPKLLVNKRRTLFTPEPLFKPPTFTTPKTVGAKLLIKRRTLFTPDPQPLLLKSTPRRRTLLPATPQIDQKVTKVSSKRKLEEEVECKENTPPRPKKPSVLASAAGQRVLMQSKVLTTPIPANKRRRTLYMTPEIGIKC